MNNQELCEWLVDNSSGVYRPSALAANRIEELQARVSGLESEVAWNRNRNNKHGITNFEEGVGGGNRSALLLHDAAVLDSYGLEVLKHMQEANSFEDTRDGNLVAVAFDQAIGNFYGKLATHADKLRKQAQEEG